MKKKEIFTLIVCGIIIVACVFAMIRVLAPTPQTKSVKTETVIPVPQEIDEKIYQQIGNLQDYGKPNLEGIGKPDLFN